MESNSVSPAARWAIANWPTPSARGAVTAFCLAQGISRSVFYKIRAQARTRGAVEALEPESRRPGTSPSRTDPDVIAQALEVRLWLDGYGLDAGPLSVIAKMRRQGLNPPSRATVARAFAAAGVAGPEPRKKPRSALRRFVYPAPNCCWQIDAMQWSLLDGRRCVVFQLIDDHSRLALASLVATGETTAGAMQVVRTAIQRWGVPRKFLSDNGRAFNPTRRGHVGALVTYLESLGVEPITGRPGRPTTQGKDERFHRTLIRWLNARPPAASLWQLQQIVEEHDDYYNHEREHQALTGKTPWEAWLATDVAPEPVLTSGLPQPPANDTGTVDKTVTKVGRITALGCEFHIGKNRAGQLTHIIWNASTVEIFDHHGQHIRTYPRPPHGGYYYGPRTTRPSTMS